MKRAHRAAHESAGGGVDLEGRRQGPASRRPRCERLAPGQACPVCGHKNYFIDNATGLGLVEIKVQFPKDLVSGNRRFKGSRMLLGSMKRESVLLARIRPSLDVRA